MTAKYPFKFKKGDRIVYRHPHQQFATVGTVTKGRATKAGTLYAILWDVPQRTGPQTYVARKRNKEDHGYLCRFPECSLDHLGVVERLAELDAETESNV